MTKSKEREELAEKAEKLAVYGFNVKEIAYYLGIPSSRLCAFITSNRGLEYSHCKYFLMEFRKEEKIKILMDKIIEGIL